MRKCVDERLRWSLEHIYRGAITVSTFTRGTTLFAFVATVAATLSIGYNLALQSQISRLNTMRDLSRERDRIVDDTFNEMIMSYMNNTHEKLNELGYQQGRIEGMSIAAQNYPPEKNAHSAIWHAGYERGLEQVNYVRESSYEDGYHKATEDMNCPANSPLRREDSARKAFQSDKSQKNQKEESAIPIPTPSPVKPNASKEESNKPTK